jgi:hypothetical protein
MQTYYTNKCTNTCARLHTHVWDFRIQKQYNLLELELKWNNAVVVKKNSNVVVINYKCRRC